MPRGCPLLVLMLALPVRPTLASEDKIKAVGEPLKDRLEFVFVGGSLTDNQHPDGGYRYNGVNCLKSSASAVITAQDLPPRPRLVSATLFIAGSLLDEPESLVPSGVLDYQDPDVAIFSNPDLTGSDPEDLDALRDAARAAGTQTILFRPPGASEPVSITAEPGAAYGWASHDTALGNVGFFVTPIDVTNVIRYEGNGVLIGQYDIGNVLADVCYGLEAVCVDPPNEPTCFGVSSDHVYATASFALLLVVQDPGLPLRTIAVFQGLEVMMTNMSKELTLDLGDSALSDPALGALAFYALEGDLARGDAGTGPCNADEYIQVDGDGDAVRDGECLNDEDNPIGNIFNSSINVQQREDAPSPCDNPGAPDQCCGQGLCPVVGVDIDRFDVDAALEPGAKEVALRIGTGSDLVLLATLVLQVDVFEPILNVDSGVRALTATDNTLQAGDRLVYSIAVSNTGNTPAKNVSVQMDAPTLTEGFSVTRIPPGAVDHSDPAGGLSGTGRVLVSDFDVAAGAIAEVRLELETVCSAKGRRLSTTTLIAAEHLTTFELSNEVVVIGPGIGECATGSETVDPLSIRALRGGRGACSAGTCAAWVLLGAALALAWRRYRRGGPGTGVLMMLAALSLSLEGCADRRRKDPPSQEEDPGPTRPELDPNNLPGQPCGTSMRVRAALADGTTFCIDRFEASLDPGELGNVHQGDGDDTILDTDGTTTASATVGLGVPPATGVSWYQAKAACENAGKRLCSQQEWERACGGSQALIYPYGDDLDDTLCNGFYTPDRMEPAVTGEFSLCVSSLGVFDLSGNVAEWTETPAERLPASDVFDDRMLRGGSFSSNANALRCVGPEFHVPPGTTLPAIGFRCCSDGPVVEP